jgi:hypothetical protein
VICDIISNVPIVKVIRFLLLLIYFNFQMAKIYKGKILFIYSSNFRRILNQFKGGKDMKKIIVLGILIAMAGLTAAQLAWTQVNVDGFGDANNSHSVSMAVYNGNLYANTCNVVTGEEVWEYDKTTWIQVNVDGFGDAANWGSWSMAIYNGNLYMGTENQTTGTEVWEYNGTTWIQVNADGFGDGNNVGIRSMAVYGNLYVGTENLVTGVEVWEYDKTAWTQINIDGFGDAGNIGSYSMAAYNGDLYVGTQNGTGTEVWEYNGTIWTQVNVDGFGDAGNKGSYSMAVYNGNLYVGTWNGSTGEEVWEYDKTTWIQVNVDGFGDGNNIGSYSMAVYNGNLYVGTWNKITGTEVWEYNGTIWTQVNVDGFGDGNNIGSYSMAAYSGNFYVGTYNWGGTGTEVWETQTQAPAALSSSISSVPSRVCSDQQITVTMTVTNTGGTQTNNVTPSALTVNTTGTASATLLSGPTPASANIPSGNSQNFTWIYMANSGTSDGTVSFTGNASGLDASSGAGVASPVTISNIIAIKICMPSQPTKPVDTNKPMMPLASYRISQVQSLLEEAQKTCTKLKDEEDSLCSTCCVNRLDEVTEYLEMAEKFFMGGNYIAANYWALKALNLLQEIEECCQE